MDMLCIAAESDPIGYVLVNGRTLTTTDLAQMTGAPEAAIQSALAELDRYGVFSRDRRQRIYSRRMVRDEKTSAINQKNGRMGGNPSLSNNVDNTAAVNPSDKPPDKPHKPEAIYQEPEEERTPPTPRKRGAASDEFEEWWQVYPHKIGKGGAKAKFAIARRKVSLAALIAGVERYVSSKPPDRPWVNPAAWLYQERWTDEPAELSLSNGKSPQGLVNGLASTSDEQWRRRLVDYKKSKFWIPSWGFPPNDPDCYAPVGLLKEFGFVENAIS